MIPATPEQQEKEASEEKDLADLVRELEEDQRSPFLCEENASALNDLRRAQTMLRVRAEKRRLAGRTAL